MYLYLQEFKLGITAKGSRMITQEQYDNLKNGDEVKYGPYSKVQFEGEAMHDLTSTMHVLLVDMQGNEKRVYKDLFMKHTTII